MHPFPCKSALTLLISGTLFMSSAHLVLADDDDDDDDEHEYKKTSYFESRQAPVVNATYSEECGACHMAYQPGLLPPQAWARIMTPDALANHYGDDASLSEAPRAEISSFLGANTPDPSWQMAPSLAGQVDVNSGLPRITASAYFKHEHDEIPARLVADNPEVGSLSQCNACHRKATEGNYDERWIDIPGQGPWRD